MAMEARMEDTSPADEPGEPEVVAPGNERKKRKKRKDGGKEEKVDDKKEMRRNKKKKAGTCQGWSCSLCTGLIPSLCRLVCLLWQMMRRHSCLLHSQWRPFREGGGNSKGMIST